MLTLFGSYKNALVLEGAEGENGGRERGNGKCVREEEIEDMVKRIDGEKEKIVKRKRRKEKAEKVERESEICMKRLRRKEERERERESAG
jgi:hypothetical protein